MCVSERDSMYGCIYVQYMCDCASVSLAQLMTHVEGLKAPICPPSSVITFVLMSQMLHMQLTMFVKCVLG